MTCSPIPLFQGNDKGAALVPPWPLLRPRPSSRGLAHESIFPTPFGAPTFAPERRASAGGGGQVGSSGVKWGQEGGCRGRGSPYSAGSVFSVRSRPCANCRKIRKMPKNSDFPNFRFNQKERLNLRDSLEQASSYSYSPSFTLSRLQTIATVLPFHSIPYNLLSLSLPTKVFLHEIRSTSLRERIVV